MAFFELVAILVTLSAFFAYFNYRYLRMATTIGIMAIALVASLGLITMARLGWPSLEVAVADLLRGFQFGPSLLHGMLAFLLFAGALHLNLEDLNAQKGTIAALSTIGVVLSALIIAGLSWLLFYLIGIQADFVHCLIYGALISPTDPIAVIGIMKSAGAPKSLEAQVAGESLFNDGVGVVLFMVLMEIAAGGQVSAGAVGKLLALEALGGIALGLGSGFVAYQMLKQVDDYKVEILLTLALAMGGYALAEYVGVSAPIATVVAGLLIGNQGRAFAMSSVTRQRLDTFWELVDEILNAVLFMLIGLEVLVIPTGARYLLAAILGVPIALVARFASVSSLLGLLRLKRTYAPRAVPILTWGGLRGGISVALALSLPPAYDRNLFLVVTYAVVVFSILVQGLTVGRLVIGEPEKAIAAEVGESE